MKTTHAHKAKFISLKEQAYFKNKKTQNEWSVIYNYLLFKNACNLIITKCMFELFCFLKYKHIIYYTYVI